MDWTRRRPDTGFNETVYMSISADPRFIRIGDLQGSHSYKQGTSAETIYYPAHGKRTHTDTQDQSVNKYLMEASRTPLSRGFQAKTKTCCLVTAHHPRGVTLYFLCSPRKRRPYLHHISTMKPVPHF